jgi:hypothetical protein
MTTGRPVANTWRASTPVGTLAAHALSRGPSEAATVQRELVAGLERHRAADGVVRPLENLEDTVQRGLEVGRVGQRLARLQQRRQLPDLSGRPGAGRVVLTAAPAGNSDVMEADIVFFTPYSSCRRRRRRS